MKAHVGLATRSAASISLWEPLCVYFKNGTQHIDEDRATSINTKIVSDLTYIECARGGGISIGPYWPVELACNSYCPRKKIPLQFPELHIQNLDISRIKMIYNMSLFIQFKPDSLYILVWAKQHSQFGWLAVSHSWQILCPIF